MYQNSKGKGIYQQKNGDYKIDLELTGVLRKYFLSTKFKFSLTLCV